MESHETKQPRNPNLPYLRVKIKSLAAEARIIRAEERRAKHRQQRDLHSQLRSHRVFQVRSAARNTLLAYGYLRGKSYRAIEPHTTGPFPWKFEKDVAKMILKYGPERTWATEANLKEAEERILAWTKAN